MKEHELKCWIAPFQALVRGDKTFEWRRNDRDFEVGDHLYLREYDGIKCRYTGRKLWVEVVYIVRGPKFEIPPGYCIMSVRRLKCSFRRASQRALDGVRKRAGKIGISIYQEGWSDGWDVLENAVARALGIPHKTAEQGDDFIKLVRDVARDLKNLRRENRRIQDELDKYEL